MKRSLKCVARYALAAGLCASMAFAAAPVTAYADESAGSAASAPPARVDAGSAAALVVAPDGTQTQFDTLEAAFQGATSQSTIKLQQDVVLTKGVEPGRVYGITLDLNGHNIDGTAVTSGAVVSLNVKNKTSVPEGADLTMGVINDVPGSGGEIKGRTPVSAQSAMPAWKAQVVIGEGVTLSSTQEGANLVSLGLNVYMRYDDSSKGYFRDGCFKVEAADGPRVYGTAAFANAVSASASDNAVVTLLNDVKTSDSIRPAAKSATLDLAGHAYTCTGNQQLIYVAKEGSSLTIKNGCLVSSSAVLKKPGAALILADNTSLTLDGVKMSIAADAYGISSNGTLNNVTVTLRNSTIDVPNGFGIYFPSSGKLEIDNSVINAKRGGVQMCAGDLVVSGEKTKIVVTGNPEPKENGDGAITDGAAISVVERLGYKDLGSVTILDGDFVSAEGVPAIKAYEFNNTDKVEGAWANAGDVVDVVGGSFSKAPQNMGDLIADGSVSTQQPDGSFGVHKHVGVKVAAKAPTCVEPGNSEHWKCEECGATFSSDAMTDEVDPVIPAKGHNVAGAIHHTAKDATETEAGNLEHWECPDCHKLFLDAKLISGTTADEVIVPALGVAKVVVTFVAGNGETFTREVEPGSKIQRPADPSKSGWEFVGWFKTKAADGTVSDEWDFGKDVVSGDITLYGGWVKKGASAQDPSTPADKPQGELPQTGDDSMLPVVSIAAAGVLAVGVGAAVAMRRRKDK